MAFFDDHLAKLLLRLMVGGMMLFHGFNKVIHGILPIRNMVQGAGWPEFMAYGVYAGELIAPLFVLLGLYSRSAAGVMAVNMLIAIYLAYGNALLSLGKHGAPAIELPLFYLIGALVILIMGPGRYGINAK